MNHTEAVTEIIETIPETKEDFKETYKTNSPFMVISVFTKQIKRLIKENDRKILIKSILKMNKLYGKGDAALKNAIENIFVYSLDSFTFCCEPTYKKMIFSKMSTRLQENYFHQVYKSGI
jgi:predicted metallopeptidase